MNSGGIVTRDVTGAQSYLAIVLLGILKRLQHFVFVPPSILSHPSNIFEVLSRYFPRGFRYSDEYVVYAFKGF